ncbi:MAG: hypothetical protein A2437_16425 [Bacteroidetes bacterium RIFOXYC2_FULL_40_12]|nr:MAG: hypothetical protein A2437_16425 [Bacteroidetes bacterium RIFOXYC2_FULL_40_12]
MVNKILAFLPLFVSLISFTLAQTGGIKGTIIDGSGLPLIGANVVVKGTTIGTVSDLDGNYTLSGIPTGMQTLVCSFIGFSNQEQSVEIKENQTIAITFTLTEDIATLEELVVVGYGTQKTKEITGAITSVKAEDFNSGNINDAAQLIQGKVAGLSISKPGADPNANFTIRLRGLSTFGANTEPLVVVDGIQGVELRSVDPEDIASMDVLKDASATAIYGTKGASGVIIITTKKGKKGTENKPMDVEFSTSLTTTSIDRRPNVLTMDEYLRFPNAVDYRSDTVNGTGTDWIDAITRTAYTKTYGIAVGGATEKSSYRMSFNYRDAEGVINETGFDQLNGRVNVTQKALNDMLNLDFNLSGVIRNEQYSPSEAVTAAIKYNPTAPIFEDTEDAEQYGGYFQRNAFSFYNPVAMIAQYEGEGKKSNLTGSFKATLEPVQGLKVSAFYSHELKSELYGYYTTRDNYFTNFGKGWAKREDKRYENRMFEGLGSYDKGFGELKSTVQVGYSWQESLAEGFWAQANEFISDAWSFNNLSEGGSSLYDASSHKDSWKNKRTLVGFFGVASFNYADTYFLRGQARKDGSSMFGENNRWGTFYGISGGVDVAKFINVSQIGRLKVRGGIGTSGNLPPEPYLTRDLWGQSSNFYSNGEYIPSYAPIRNQNPNLKWEVKKETNIGLDYGLFGYKVTGTFDYFTSTSSDLMLEYNVPSTKYTASKMWYNIGELKNSGLEFALSINVIDADNFSWTTDLNFTKYLTTELVKISTEEILYNGGNMDIADLGAPGYTGVNIIRLGEGDAIGNIVGYTFTGIDSVGKYTYLQDSLGKNIKSVIGNGLPKFQLGWGNTFKYKNFDLSFFVRGVFGHDLVNTNNARYGSPSTINIQSGMNTALDYFNATQAPSFSDIYVENANFIRLDNFSLGYTLNLSDNKYVSKVRAYISGQNLFTITNYTGTSPEVRYADKVNATDSPNPLAPGIDRGDTYFGTRSFTFGVNVTF